MDVAIGEAIAKSGDSTREDIVEELSLVEAVSASAHFGNTSVMSEQTEVSSQWEGITGSGQVALGNKVTTVETSSVDISADERRVGTSETSLQMDHTSSSSAQVEVRIDPAYSPGGSRRPIRGSAKGVESRGSSLP